MREGGGKRERKRGPALYFGWCLIFQVQVCSAVPFLSLLSSLLMTCSIFVSAFFISAFLLRWSLKPSPSLSLVSKTRYVPFHTYPVCIPVFRPGFDLKAVLDLIILPIHTHPYLSRTVSLLAQLNYCY